MTGHGDLHAGHETLPGADSRATSMISVAHLLDSASAGVAFVIYLGVTLYCSLRDEGTKGRADRWSGKQSSKKQDEPRRSGLYWIHLSGNLLNLALCAAHAVLLARARNAHLAMRADHDVASIMFGSLLWLVLFLGMTDNPQPAGAEQYVGWMIMVVSYGISAAISTATEPENVWDVIVQWIRWLVTLVLLLTIVIVKTKTKFDRKADELKVEETQPLLDHTDAEVSNNKNVTDDDDDDDWEDDDDSSVLSDASDDEDQSESKDDENDAAKEEKRQHKALRDRPWHEYLASFAIFVPYIRPRTARQYGYLSIMVLNTIVARGINLGQPLMLGAVIDDLAHRRLVLWRILVFVALRFASSGSGTILIRSIASFRLNIELNNALMSRCFSHIMDLDASYHMSKNTPATWKIMDRGQFVISLMQSICFDYLPVIADLIIALFVVSHLFGAYLCFVAATTMVLLSWSNRITLTKKTSMRRTFIDLWRHWYSHISDSIQFWRTVSEFGKIDHEKERHTDKTTAYTQAALKQQSFRIYLSGLQEVVVTAGFTFVCIIAALEIVAGRLDVSRFVVLITYWSQIMSPVTRIAGIAGDIAEELVDAEKLLVLLEKRPKVVSKPNAPPFLFKGGHITFENCDFSYDGQRVVTKNVSFDAKPGQTIALVGETGGGKSTIFNLLYRFYDPSNGRVLVDGQDISQIDLHSYRAHLGVVPQDVILFNTTILKNVRYGNLHATKAEVIDACKAAQFHDKVMKFPKKYKQKVGELAQKLSGGEKQRLAIARAILNNPGILLLDEATSAVDSVTETKIQESLQRLSRGRTTIIIAHRLSTIMDADCILVVRNGAIVEAGTHDELLDRGNGAYKELWEAQLKLASGKGKAERPKRADGDNPPLVDDGIHGEDGKEGISGVDAAAQNRGGLATPPLSYDVTPAEISSDELERSSVDDGVTGDDEQRSMSASSSSSSSGKGPTERKSQGYGTL